MHNNRTNLTVIDRLANRPRVKEVALAKRINRYAYFSELNGGTGPRTLIEGEEVLNFGSNNYLGMASHPAVVEAGHRGLDNWGAGVTGSRLMNGNLKIHRLLEEELADFYGREAALVFPTGYTANLGLMSALLERGDAAFVDEEVHASLLDGISLARARVRRFQHSEPTSLSEKLEGASTGLCAIEGVYSMRGDHAPVRDLVAVASKFGYPMIVDEAHGLGTAGRLGRGVVEVDDVIDSVAAITVTFSKSLGSCGGAVIGDSALIDALRVMARPFLFTASNTPTAIECARMALRLLREGPEMVSEVQLLANHLRRGLRDAQIESLGSSSPVVAVEIGSDFETLHAWRLMRNRGLFVNAVVSPAVAVDKGLIRMSVMRNHTLAEVEQAVETFVEVFSEVVPNRLVSEPSFEGSIV